MSDDDQGREESSGQFTPKYPTVGFLAALDELDEPPTSEVADAVGCPHNTAHYRLTNLEEDGLVQSRSVSHLKVWSLTDEGSAELAERTDG